MNKRYQVFISSTYSDLVEERRYVMQSLMEMDCIPAGMELFPATDEEQWIFIKKIIDDCDYYLLIIGGRYGSTTDEGISYTEKEFNYAREKGLPIICLIHGKPDNISIGKSETAPELQKKLIDFREKAKQGRLVKFWENPEELQGIVAISLNSTMKNHPAIGFVRADLVPDENATTEILKLRNQILKLEEQLEYAANNAPVGSEQFAQGDDLFEINYTYKSRPELDYFDIGGKNTQTYSSEAKIDWNTIFSKISPFMVNEAEENVLETQLNTLIQDNEISHISKRKENSEKTIFKFQINNSDFQTIKIQLKALGLIMKSTKNRGIKDQGTYWTLTTYGDNVMTRLIAIKKRD
jgi:hypothetical protein